ncbi:MAG: prepilin-type N-terminal cleavage/methylation domain-containing protein, partial [Candidatus Marinimicrobia bacterium]|nr:prepilin-type N-terminal cleavage/methylation domain-containing protein [Candidatus Neomarinimicrobiota bacterium]
MRKENQKGFSLVELMIVLVIIGILAAVGVPIYTSNVQKAKMSEADAALGTIRTALRVYYAE